MTLEYLNETIHPTCLIATLPGREDVGGAGMIWPNVSELAAAAGTMLIVAGHIFVVAYLARWKGRSMFGWLVLTHAFPVLAFAVLLLSAPLPGSRAAQQAAARAASTLSSQET